ncbi:hypothetical protein JOH52_000825 [Sinorhizobium meliloti]|nr:hypothetical protein [Sinorhizobium meliloti]GEC36472.1 hypothetical protein EME01_05440 [Sinorhizobium meliloti]
MVLKRSPEEISVEIGGLTYHGAFWTDKDLVTLRTAYGIKTRTQGATPADTIARELLRELVLERKADRTIWL